jgi:hypothetical protein
MPKYSSYPSGSPAALADALLACRSGTTDKTLTVQDLLTALGLFATVTPAAGTDLAVVLRAGVPKLEALSDVVALAAGGSTGHNFLINGAFDVAQRATSYAATTTAAYGCVDRWYMKQATTAQVTFSQAAPSPALPGWSNCLKALLTGTSTGQIEWGEIIESIDVSAFQGQTVVLSFEAVKGSTWNPANLGVIVTTGTGVDQGLASLVAATWTGQANTLNTTKAPAAAWGQFTATVAIPSGCTEVAVRFTATPTGAAVDANSYLMITGVDIRPGSTAPAVRDSRPEALELLLCQRFLPAASGVNTFATGHSFTATDVLCDFYYPVTPRVTPTGLTAATAGADFQVWDGVGNVVACNALPTLNRASIRAATIRGTTATGLTAGRGSSLLGANANAKILLTGCEL